MDGGFHRQPGDEIERYRLVSLLGQGGMGEVWIAENTALKQRVALKFLSLRRSEHARLRLQREAQAAAKVKHPSIVQVFDIGTDPGGDPFIVMELVEGRNLADILDTDGRLTVKEGVEIAIALADALHTAHCRDIIHRDVKPENVLLVESLGRTTPKLLDFGVARFVNDAKGLTSDGVLIGTPGYIAPEGVSHSHRADARTDVWGLAVTLYETIVGFPPFDGPTLGAILAAVTLQEPRWPGDVHGLDAGLWRIIDRGLAKDPSERFADAQAFGAALRSWLTKQDPPWKRSARAPTLDAPPAAEQLPAPSSPDVDGSGDTARPIDDLPRQPGTGAPLNTPRGGNVENFDAAIFASLGER